MAVILLVIAAGLALLRSFGIDLGQVDIGWLGCAFAFAGLAFAGAPARP